MPKAYKIEVQIKNDEQNEVLSFHVYKPDEKSAINEALRKAEIWANPGFVSLFEIKSVLKKEYAHA